MEDITKSKPQLIGNNIQLLMDKVAVYENSIERKAQVREDLHKIIPKNRLTGLINGNYMLSLKEAVSLSQYFNCSIEDVLRFEK
jgi:hypothetical protein